MHYILSGCKHVFLLRKPAIFSHLSKYTTDYHFWFLFQASNYFLFSNLTNCSPFSFKQLGRLRQVTNINCNICWRKQTIKAHLTFSISFYLVLLLQLENCTRYFFDKCWIVFNRMSTCLNIWENQHSKSLSRIMLWFSLK